MFLGRLLRSFSSGQRTAAGQVLPQSLGRPRAAAPLFGPLVHAVLRDSWTTARLVKGWRTRKRVTGGAGAPAVPPRRLR